MDNIYKAKTIDNNQWVYGYFVKYPDGLTVIFLKDRWESIGVYEDTVCRSIGVEDKNGNPLFVNDIIDDFGGGVNEVDYDSPNYHPDMRFPPTKISGNRKRVGIIVEEDGVVRIKTKEMSYSYNISSASPFNQMELIGSVFDGYQPLKQ